MAKILIVEDDADINQILAKIMQKQGHETVQAFSGSEADLRIFMNEEIPYDLIMLDLMLPGIMGEDLIQKIREKSEVPVIVLSAKTALEDRVRVLNLGADDYLIKPFEKEEVIARVNGALRRYKRFQTTPVQQTEAAETEQQVLTYKELMLYPEERVAKLCGTELSLTAHEYELLLLLVQNPGKVYSRENLYEQVWQGGYYGEDNTVNVHISNLRKKLAAFTDEEYIKTVWGIGFKMA